ncbi:MAG: DUF488 family protein [Cellulosilyticaceae bacterium]
MTQPVYTLGYAHHTQESFLELLEKYHINCTIDVRTVAYSGFHPQFNKEPLKIFLKMHGIFYIHMYKEFGIIRQDPSLNNQDGYLDFNKLAQLSVFQEGIKRVENGIEKGFIICFICAEKNAADCHRSTLVGKALSKKGYTVKHIKSDGGIETQEELEERIMAKYYTQENQINLFGDNEKEDPLERAYRICSNSIVEVNSKRVLKEAYVSPKRGKK